MAKKLRCLIIDDEPLAVDLLRDYVERTPFLGVAGSYYNAPQAMEILTAGSVDLVFIDIQMPNITGIDFIRSLENKPMFIFTTAYPEYALQGFELNALDYLVKPISYERFLNAANRALKYHTLTVEPASLSPKAEFIMIRTDQNSQHVALNDILYIEGLKDYLKVFTTKGRLITRNTMKEMEKKLTGLGFSRIHKSYIVSLRHIEAIERNRVIIHGEWLPISESYRDSFMTTINRSSI